MSKLIDADALMATLGITDMDCNKCEWHDSEWNDCKRGGEFEDACCAIENAPTIEERKTGKWIRTRTMRHDGELYCDQCEQEHPEQKIIWNFCPNCGARMVQEGEDNDSD